MQHVLRRQNGFSMLSMALFILIGAFLLNVLFRVVPAYIDDYMLGRIIGSLEETESHRDMEDLRDVREYLRKRLQMENIEAVSVSDMKMELDDGRLYLEFSYEVRSGFIGNIDTVVQFDHQHELRMP
ncbi:DUF4845 domain-containing protein [Halomonadaceae bacterium KBTZ08]